MDVYCKNIENEMNIMRHCPLYADLREDLFCHFRIICEGFDHLCTVDKFNCIMKTGGCVTVKVVFNSYSRSNLCVYMWCFNTDLDTQF